MNYSIRKAEAADGETIRALLPRLADFEVPSYRQPHDLWAGDLELFEQWTAGKQPDCFVFVGCTEKNHILGMAMVRLRPDALSGAPSCHLEAIAVTEAAQGSGLGRQLIAVCEQEAHARGALSMTLHVFENNYRARRVYEQAGFTVEIMRYRKDLLPS
ncbi:MAG: GNAT family N-acetyltransferase [Anaerolineae bacterium]|nr:GNAT family N-acetyltransferase [Anaerolineae bacterium]